MDGEYLERLPLSPWGGWQRQRIFYPLSKVRSHLRVIYKVNARYAIHDTTIHPAIVKPDTAWVADPGLIRTCIEERSEQFVECHTIKASKNIAIWRTYGNERSWGPWWGRIPHEESTGRTIIIVDNLYWFPSPRDVICRVSSHTLYDMNKRPDCNRGVHTWNVSATLVLASLDIEWITDTLPALEKIYVDLHYWGRVY